MILRIDADRPDDRRLGHVEDCLRDGGVIIYPTDSVYTLGCDISHRAAYERICALKGIRPNKANFSIVCHDLSHLSDFTLSLRNATYKLMNRVLPGPYTFILDANRHVQKVFGYKKREVGIRVPDHAIPQAIVQRLGQPILSASIKNDDTILEYVTDPADLVEAYDGIVDIIIDGGPGGLEPSTVIDCTGEDPVVVRAGAGAL